MDEKVILILAFFVIVIPVVLGVANDMLKRWLKHKE